MLEQDGYSTLLLIQYRGKTALRCMLLLHGACWQPISASLILEDRYDVAMCAAQDTTCAVQQPAGIQWLSEGSCDTQELVVLVEMRYSYVVLLGLLTM